MSERDNQELLRSGTCKACSHFWWTGAKKSLPDCHQCGHVHQPTEMTSGLFMPAMWQGNPDWQFSFLARIERRLSQPAA